MIVYDTTSGRYRDTVTGRFVSAQKALDLMQDRIDDGIDRMQKMILAVQTPNNFATVQDWQIAMATELRNMHYQMTMLGAGGKDNVSQAMWGKLGSVLKAEYKYLQGFADVVSNLSLEQIQIRMAMYANKVWNSYWNARTAVMRSQVGATHEARELTPGAEHCETTGGRIGCIELAAKGIVKIGTLPNPGDGSTPCLSNDKCIKVYYRKIAKRFERIG